MITLKDFEDIPREACLWVQSCPKENNVSIGCTRCKAYATLLVDAVEAAKWWKNRIKELNKQM